MIRTIRVECRAQSHAPKVALVGRILVQDREGARRVGLEEILDGDQLLDPEKLMGSAATGPDWAYSEEHPVRRQRANYRCPLCGLHVPLREENALTLADGLQQAGVSSVSLESLAATLS